MNWEFHPDARDEFNESLRWYEKRKIGLGGEFLGEARDTIGRILERPEKWRKIHGDVRSCRLKRFPFAVLYRLRHLRVEIIAVAHASRRPDYWKSRL